MEFPIHGGIVLIDCDDYGLLSSSRKWNVSSNGYAVRRHIRGDYTLMHRLIMRAQKGQYVDHIDGNKLNNQKANLRICTHAENMRNMHSDNRLGTSKYRGVYWHRKRSKWRAEITLNYKSRHIGYYDSEIDAAIAYNAKAIELFGEFARLNEIKNIGA